MTFNLRGRLDLGERALRALAAPVLEGGVVARRAALRAAVDDHLDVGVVAVVVGELVVQLVRQRLRHHAVDHSSEPPSFLAWPATTRPSESSPAFQALSDSSIWSSSSPLSSIMTGSASSPRSTR